MLCGTLESLYQCLTLPISLHKLKKIDRNRDVKEKTINGCEVQASGLETNFIYTQAEAKDGEIISLCPVSPLSHSPDYSDPDASQENTNDEQQDDHDSDTKSHMDGNYSENSPLLFSEDNQNAIDKSMIGDSKRLKVECVNNEVIQNEDDSNSQSKESSVFSWPFPVDNLPQASLVQQENKDQPNNKIDQLQNDCFSLVQKVFSNLWTLESKVLYSFDEEYLSQVMMWLNVLESMEGLLNDEERE